MIFSLLPTSCAGGAFSIQNSCLFVGLSSGCGIWLIIGTCGPSCRQLFLIFLWRLFWLHILLFNFFDDSVEYSLMNLLMLFLNNSFGILWTWQRFLGQGFMSEFLDEFFCTIFGIPNFCSHFSDALEFETLDTFQSGFYTASFRTEVASIL